MPNALPSSLFSRSFPVLSPHHSLVAGLCEGYHSNALVQAAQLVIASALHTALWRCTLLQHRGQYAVSTIHSKVMIQLVVTCPKHIHKTDAVHALSNLSAEQMFS